MKDLIYLDYNATTPIDPEVEAAMRPYLNTYFGNPSSRYSYGADARKAVELARANVAALIGASPEEIIFTSGGSESDNHALKGAAFALRNKGNHIIVSTIEHPAILEVCTWLQKQGFEISYLPVDNKCMVEVEKLESLITPKTILISVMHANNEIGTIQPIAELAAIAHRHGVLFHTDAAQSAGKIKIDVNELGVDLLTLAGHKLYAPKGIGALYIRTGVVLDNLIHGAGQEHNLRAGTENLLEIVGFGKAAEIAARDLSKNNRHLKDMRDLLLDEMLAPIPGMHIHTDIEKSLPNTLSVAFRGIPADTLLSTLPGLAASAGAACHPAGVTSSHVLIAMGVTTEYAMGTIRLSTGKHSTAEEMKLAAKMIADAYNAIATPENIQDKPISSGKIKLTQFTHGLGCACKMQPADLENVLRKLPVTTDPNVLVGNASGDDAAVYLMNPEQAIVQTLDFFTPIVDDPYDFGAIAAANALSDIYAMGAKPLFALNIVAFPVQRLPLEILEQILVGAADKATEAGISIIGGHSIDDTEPKFGMCVSGLVHPEKAWKNIGAQPGDILILTKPLGTGIISTAVKSGLADETTTIEATKWMKQLNQKASVAFLKLPVNACTDITGFGLAGHLSEMTRGSNVNAEIVFNTLPFMNQVKELALAGAIPGGTHKNLDFYKEWIRWNAVLSGTEKLMFCDAQTSGGLLVSLPEKFKDQALQELLAQGIDSAVVIGRISGPGKGFIDVV
ncbi:MAG: selenide, water dikinase SelD [Lentimicrobiaceae bacterium]|jgi:cysteine desulfurase NifS/selenium donor protein